MGVSRPERSCTEGGAEGAEGVHTQGAKRAAPEPGTHIHTLQVCNPFVSVRLGGRGGVARRVADQVVMLQLQVIHQESNKGQASPRTTASGVAVVTVNHSIMTTQARALATLC